MLKKIMLHLFWVYAPLNKESSLIKKTLKILEAFITVIITVWAFAFILLLPIWFSEKHVINGHVIYSNSSVDSKLLQNVMDLTKEKIKKSGIDIPELLPTIYLHNNDIFYDISTRSILSDTSATYQSLYKRIEIKLNTVYTNGEINQDWLSALIAHEKIHSLQFERYGIFAAWFTIPKWVSEGYAEYTGYDHAPPDKDYVEWLRRVNAGESINKYFEYWVLVRHAIDKMGYSPDELHNGEVDREMVKKSLLIWIRKRAEKNRNKNTQASQLSIDENTTSPLNKISR